MVHDVDQGFLEDSEDRNDPTAVQDRVIDSRLILGKIKRKSEVITKL